ncbi:MAG: penicillin-binding protein 2 [Selenomonas sp.]|uniref:penicillin-binding protein 2 n=1 Tax=Selenomonas sp. AE3005 TaxID=1485543 RepID=UPI00047F76DF|nr:penicillin-binding protein 2 [Selenomonas sp. AE3005]MBQ2088030.1 penicillin-binding protein 2 [Selenomonas sp.]
MLENDEYGVRLDVLGYLAVLVIAVLIGRAGYLQIYDGENYARLAEGNRIRIIPTMAPRGTFFDRNGELLVQNRPGFAVSLMPVMTKIDPVVIQRLSTLLKVPVEDIDKKIAAHTGFDPIRIKADVTPDIVTIIEEQKDNYPGVVIEVQPIRDYMNKEEAAHTYGYVSEINDMELEKKKDEGYKSGDIIGKFGLEKVYDKELRGENGGQQVEVDVTGKPVQILGIKQPIPGADLYLTIDKNLQTAAEKAVDEQLKQIHANAAAVVCLNPQTGEVLAMVSRPAFDPNLFAHGISSKDWDKLNNNPYHPMDNKTITGEYPPGSTFKIITGTAALTENVVSPSELIMDSGHHWIIPKGNAEGEALGLINFQQAMAHSDNVYFYEMGNRLGIDRLEKYARMFGLGKITGIDLPYESDGLVANRRYKEKNFEDGDWYLSETFDAAIGQGFNLVTPLQAAMVMGEIAANGKRFKPHLVNRIVGPDGSTVKEFKPELLSTLDVPADVISLVQAGLHDVTKVGTAASIFRGFPIEIAGKTGTAENPHGRDHGWFVAYGPFANPDIVVAVVVEQGGFGSQSAVPIGRKVLEAWFGLNKPAAPQNGAAQQAAKQ